MVERVTMVSTVTLVTAPWDLLEITYTTFTHSPIKIAYHPIVAYHPIIIEGSLLYAVVPFLALTLHKIQ